MTEVTKSGILNALKKVEDPKFNKDLLILNSIKNVESKKHELKVDISLSLPDPDAVQRLKEKFEAALSNEFGEFKKIDINLEAKAAVRLDTSKNKLLPGVKNTIAVASGKGGVGKSTVAVNLAVALAKDGASVGLIDADIYGPSIPLMLGIKDRPKVYQDNQSMKIIPLQNYGVKVISIGVLVEEDAPVIWRGPMASGAVKQFMTDVDWGELDYLIFDMPPGTGDIQLTLVQTIPLSGAVIVTTPQEVSLIDARKALKMFTRVNVPVFGIVENMSYFIAPDTGKKYDIFGTGGGSKIAKELQTRFLGGIPIDPKIRIGGDNGVPIVYDSPDSEHGKAVTDIARKLAEQITYKNSEQGSSGLEILLDDED